MKVSGMVDKLNINQILLQAVLPHGSGSITEISFTRVC